MLYSQNIEACLDKNIGASGVSFSDIEEFRESIDAGLLDLARHYNDDSMPLLHLPEKRDDLKELEAIAEKYRDRFDNVVVLGTGGSSLGAQALYALSGPRTKPGLPRLHVLDSVDPFGFSAIVEHFDLSRTGWIVVSKSGGTAETLMQFMTVLPGLQAALGDNALKQHITVITEPGDRPLRRIASHFSLPVVDHDPNLGGRYSVFSPVGLLPALIAGLDAEAVRAGAQTVMEQLLSFTKKGGDCFDFPPALGAALVEALSKKRGLNTSVMMAYGDRLGPFTLWYRQLWAESLGKAGKGTTPIFALGPVDQHSQLQLWLDGPKDKMFTIVGTEKKEIGDMDEQPNLPAVPSNLANLTGLAYLADRSLSDLLCASHRATADTLAEKGKPVRRIDLVKVDEAGLGAVMMHFMLETILAARLLEVDPFDQPAVERGKVLTRAYLQG